MKKSAQEKNAALKLEGVSKSFPLNRQRKTVLQDINLVVQKGEFVSIVGPSGCGKSTLLRLIAGVEPEFDGVIEDEQGTISGPGRARGMLFQEHRLFPWLTVRRNIELGAYNAKLGSGELRALVDAQLTRVGLTEFAEAFPQQLSGGMAQRVSIARTLMGSPALLLLDEPFSALDAFTKIRLQTELASIWASTGITMLLVTHDIEEAVFLSDRIVVLDANPGRIKQVIVNSTTHPRIRTSAQFNAVRESLFRALNLTAVSDRKNLSLAI